MGLAQRGVGVVQHALAVSAEQTRRCKPRKLATRRKQAQHRMDAEPLSARTEVGRRAERIGEEKNPAARPPQGYLLPPAASADPAELERRDSLLRHDEMRHVEPGR